MSPGPCTNPNGFKAEPKIQGISSVHDLYGLRIPGLVSVARPPGEWCTYRPAGAGGAPSGSRASSAPRRQPSAGAGRSGWGRR